MREVAGSVSRTIKHLLIIGLLSISGACGKCGKFSPPRHKKAGNMPGSFVGCVKLPAVAAWQPTCFQCLTGNPNQAIQYPSAGK